MGLGDGVWCLGGSGAGGCGIGRMCSRWMQMA